MKAAVAKKLHVAAKNVRFSSSLDARGGMIDRFYQVRAGSFSVKGRATKGSMVFVIMKTGKVRIDELKKQAARR